jgi:phosphoketolase
MSQLLPSARELAAHALVEPGFAAWQQSAARCKRVLGYRNRGGALGDVGILFANQATWAHVLQAVAEVVGIPAQKLLSREERAALAGQG